MCQKNVDKLRQKLNSTKNEMQRDIGPYGWVNHEMTWVAWVLGTT